MATDTIVNNLIINKLTKAQYDEIETPSSTELYFVPDEIDNTPTQNSDNPVKSGGIYTALANKQDVLIPGTTLKTINNESLLGSGDIVINGGSASGGNAKIFYGTCETAAATAAKVVTCEYFTANDLVKGAIIFVTFSATNSAAAASLTLNVNGTGAHNIKKTYNAGTAANLANVGEIRANDTYLFQYNGTYWVCMTLDYNTTYSSLSQADANTGTATTGRLITAKVLNDTIISKAHALVYEIDVTNIVNGVLSINDTAPFIAINTAHQAGKTVYVKLINGGNNIPDDVIMPLKSVTIENNVATEYIFQLTATLIGGGTDVYVANVYDDSVDVYYAFVNGGGSGSGEANVIESVKVNGTALTPDANKAVDITAVPASIVTQDATHRFTTDTEKSTWNSKTDNIGTITGITMNGASKGTSGVVDLGTVITAHQDISGKQDTLVSGTNIKTIDGESVLGNGNITTCIVYSLDASGMTSTKTISGSEPYTAINSAYTNGKTVYVRLYNFDASLNMPEIILPLMSLNFNSTPYTFIMNLTVPGYGSYYASVSVYTNSAVINFQTLTLLPPVTSADNGKILTVVNGTPTWVTPTTIYTGTGTPSSSQGVDGDIYLQTS